jgi:hypothetical protein
MPTVSVRRPQVQIVTPSASPEEAAAVMAAVDRFLRDTTPPAAPDRPVHNPWLRAARLEGVGREADQPTAWGDPHPLGR